MAIYLQQATNKDITKIMQIINQAKQLLKEDGNPQWQNGRPNQEIITTDIVKKQAYCLMVDQQIDGIAILQTTPETTYAKIDGAWHQEHLQYATIHRIAISANFRGQHLGQFFMSNLISQGKLKGINNFRIDTHPVNLRMQKLIKKTGFKYRGTIQIDQTKDGLRYAYELNL